MTEQLKLFGLPAQEYVNQAGSTVFEVSGALNELRSVYKDIRNNYILTNRNTPLEISDGRVVYIKCCHAITNMMEPNENMVIRIITSPEPVRSKCLKDDRYKLYL